MRRKYSVRVCVFGVTITRWMVSRRAFLTQSVALGGAFIATPVRGEDDIRTRALRLHDGLKTLVAEFVQTRRLSVLRTEVRSKGKLWFRAPGHVRWELFAPDDVVYVMTPDRVAYKTKHRTVTAPPLSAKMRAELADLRAVLSFDLKALSLRYDTTLEERVGGGLLIAAKRPEGKQSPILRASLTLGPDWQRPERVQLAFGPKDETDVAFEKGALNVPVDDGLFRL